MAMLIMPDRSDSTPEVEPRKSAVALEMVDTRMLLRSISDPSGAQTR